MDFQQESTFGPFRSACTIPDRVLPRRYRHLGEIIHVVVLVVIFIAGKAESCQRWAGRD